MTHDYHKPTHTLEGDGTYNSTQVRLYGIHANTKIEVPLALGKAKLVSNEKGNDGSKKKKLDFSNALNLNSRSGEEVFVISTSARRSIGVIYGYAYEGHCYDLPRPMIMLIPAQPGAIPVKDCDFDRRPGYSVWVVDKLDQCDVIDINSGFIEQLVLDANMPGKRSPSTYRATMQFAHRSGRMPE
jgi:hypothetical protein